jgi:hypothetical protein
MDKEKILTIFLGLLVGGLLAGGYFASGKLLPLLNGKKQETITINTKPKSSPVKTASLLTLSSPEDFSNVTTGTITVSGKTLPEARLVVFANADEKIATASADGNFSFDIKLESGDNEIVVTAFDPNSNLQTSLKRTVVKEIAKQ